MSLPPRRTFSLVFVAALLACGCGGPAATPVTGKLLENGEPIKPPAEKLPPGDKGLRLSFVPADGAADKESAHWAQINDGGSFRIDGPNNKGIPPGKYRVTVQKGAMGKSTTIEIADVIEIPKGSAVTVEVDVGKKTAKVVP